MIFGNKHVRRQTLKIWELTLCYLVIMATTMEVAVREAGNAARDNGGAVAICSCYVPPIACPNDSAELKENQMHS
jgi:hypothetical protein